MRAFTKAYGDLVRYINNIADEKMKHLPGLRWESLEIIKTDKEAMKHELDKKKTYFAMVAFEQNNKDTIRTGRDVDFAKDGLSTYRNGVVAGICSGHVDFPGVEGESGGILVAIFLSGGTGNWDDTSQARLRDRPCDQAGSWPSAGGALGAEACEWPSTPPGARARA